MHMSRRATAAIAFAVLTAAPAAAVDYRGGVEGAVSCPFERCGDFGSGGGSRAVRFDANWIVGTLFNEPVVNTQISWSPKDVSAHLPAAYRRADPSLGSDPEALKRIRIYDTKLKMTVAHDNEHYTLEVDPGVPQGAGQGMSFNVAGSPDWDRLLKDSNGKFIPPEQAKDVLRAGFNVVKTELTQARMDTSQLEQWWFGKNIGRYNDVLRQTVDQRLDALSLAFGLPVKEIRDQLDAYAKGKSPREHFDKLKEVLDKLAPDRLPAKYLGGTIESKKKLATYAILTERADEYLADSLGDLPPVPSATPGQYESWLDQMRDKLLDNKITIARLQENELRAQLLEAEKRAAAEREAAQLKAEAERRAAEEMRAAEQRAEEAREAERRADEAREERRERRAKRRYRSKPYESGIAEWARPPSGGCPAGTFMNGYGSCVAIFTGSDGKSESARPSGSYSMPETRYNQPAPARAGTTTPGPCGRGPTCGK